MSDDRITMSEIARRLGVSLPVVSNWRRRYPLFPKSESTAGQDLFATHEVAGWLDGRKIQRNDLEPGELPGSTYGSRFRKVSNLTPPAQDPLDAELWQQFLRLRGTEDIATLTDLVLRLLYLAGCHEQHWLDIVNAERWQRPEWLERVADVDSSVLGDLRLAGRAFDDARGHRRLAEIVGLVDRVRQSGRIIDVFEYLLDRFAASEGRRGADMHTPPALIRLLVEMVAPEPGSRVFDPCCGSGRFLVGAAQYLAAHGTSQVFQPALTGHALSERSALLASMNLWLRGVQADVDSHAGRIFDGYGSLTADTHFDVILSNPPFDLKGAASADAMPDLHGRYGSLPKGRTNFAWLQYVASALADSGRAAVVMPGGTLSREGTEQQVRGNMIDDGVIEAILALPPGLFASTGIPVTVWLLSRSPQPRREILFVDATHLGHLISRTQRILSDQDQELIVNTVAGWRAGDGYRDISGFSASVVLQRIREQDYVLTPARYVGARAPVEAPLRSISQLRVELAELDHRAAEVDRAAERQLDRVLTWIP